MPEAVSYCVCAGERPTTPPHTEVATSAPNAASLSPACAGRPVWSMSPVRSAGGAATVSTLTGTVHVIVPASLSQVPATSPMPRPAPSAARTP